jgi:transcriptional regulator
MYVPANFKNKDNGQIFAFLKQNAFANLVTTVNGRLWATHLPLMLSAEGTKLHGHVSRANVQWKSFEEAKEVMAIFNGPHAYISSSWYDHENVPTWNYIGVHVYGTIRIIEGEELLSSLKKLTDKYEARSARPVSVEGMSKAYLDAHIKALVGFEIVIQDIQAAYKLSQNRDKKNYETIIDELEKRNDAHDQEVATEMSKNKSSLYS